MSTKLGITLSHPHLEHLGLSIDSAVTEALKFGFSHIRLGAYWNRIEKSSGHYDFTELKSILAQCQKINQPVVLTVGVKAPRWPEFYWPDFIKNKSASDTESQNHILRFVEQTVKAVKSFTCITHWQVENEPLDPSGPENLIIAETFLSKEVQVVRQLDARQIMINLWGNDLLARGFFHQAEKLADIVGLDLYYKQFMFQALGHSVYSGPRQTDKKLQKIIQVSSKPIWLTELQAEPWEKDEKGYQADRPASINPELLRENFLKAKKLAVEEVLLWGFEYWLWRAQKGDNRYLNEVRSLISK